MWLKDLKIEMIIFFIKCELKNIVKKKREKHILPFFEVLTTQTLQNKHVTHALDNNENNPTNLFLQKPFFATFDHLFVIVIVERCFLLIFVQL